MLEPSAFKFQCQISGWFGMFILLRSSEETDEEKTYLKQNSLPLPMGDEGSFGISLLSHLVRVDAPGVTWECSHE